MNTRSEVITAADLMTSPVLTVLTTDTLGSVARLFTSRMISAAAVLTPDGRPVGVISKTDLVRYGKEFWSKKNLPLIGAEDDSVETWMTPTLLAVPGNTSACAMARRMSRYHMHHMFVKGSTSDEIVGVVSSFDVLRAYAALCGRLEGDERTAL